jgi:hypothetical protein
MAVAQLWATINPSGTSTTMSVPEEFWNLTTGLFAVTLRCTTEREYELLLLSYALGGGVGAYATVECSSGSFTSIT